MTDYLINVYKEGGKLGAFKKCAKELGINTDEYVLKDSKLEDELAWDVITITNPGKKILQNEYKRLMKRA